MRNIAIILAAGSGKRAGGDTPKQFKSIAGKTVLEHTLDKFEKHPAIEEIILVVSKEYMEYAGKLITTAGYAKVKHIIPGGQERYHSTLSAIGLYRESKVNVLIHDAARPLVSSRIISEVIAALTEYQAVDVAVPVSDTIIETDAGHRFITGVPNRDRLYRVQTPQGFYLPVLSAAYQEALADANFQTTDDCGVVLKYLPEVKIKIVTGSHANFKITFAEDLVIAEKLLSLYAND